MILSMIAFIQYADFYYIANSLYVEWPIFYCLIDPITILLPFCLYGHMRALQGDNILNYPKRSLIHLLPTVVILAIDTHLWTNPLSDHLIYIQHPPSENIDWFPASPHGNIYWLIVGLLCLFYWYKQTKRGCEDDVKPWVMRIQLLLLMTITAVIIRIISIEIFDTYFSMAYAQGFFAIYFVYIVLSFSVLPHSPNLQLKDMSDNTGNLISTNEIEILKRSNTDPAPAKLSASELEPLKEMFEELDLALKRGLYKDNELSLSSLAKSCNLTNHQASAAINYFSGTNFYDWVNQHRISAAKEVLTNTTLPVTTIFHQLGFNSKSTFYTAFKRIVGCTPTEYRKSETNSQEQ